MLFYYTKMSTLNGNTHGFLRNKVTTLFLAIKEPRSFWIAVIYENVAACKVLTKIQQFTNLWKIQNALLELEFIGFGRYFVTVQVTCTVYIVHICIYTSDQLKYEWHIISFLIKYLRVISLSVHCTHAWQLMVGVLNNYLAGIFNTSVPWGSRLSAFSLITRRTN